MFVEEFGDEGKRFLDRLGIVRIQETCVHGAEGGSRLGHVKSDAQRGLRAPAHRQVVALTKRRKPEGRSRSGDRGGLPHAATKGFARSYRINLRLLPELAVSSGHDVLILCLPRRGGLAQAGLGRLRATTKANGRPC